MFFIIQMNYKHSIKFSSIQNKISSEKLPIQINIENQQNFCSLPSLSLKKSESFQNGVMFDDLIPMEALRRVSFQSLSRNNLGFERSSREFLQIQRQENPYFLNMTNSINTTMTKKDSSNQSRSSLAHHSYPTIELELSNLKINSCNDHELQQEKKNGEESEEKVISNPRKFYQGSIQLSINSSTTCLFIGKVILISKKQKILFVKSKGKVDQKFKLNRNIFNLFKRKGVIHQQVEIWDKNTCQWVPGHSINLQLKQFKNSKE